MIEFERILFFSNSFLLSAKNFVVVVFNPRRITTETIFAKTNIRLYFPYPTGPKILPAETLRKNNIKELKKNPPNDQERFIANSRIFLPDERLKMST